MLRPPRFKLPLLRQCVAVGRQRPGRAILLVAQCEPSVISGIAGGDFSRSDPSRLHALPRVLHGYFLAVMPAGDVTSISLIRRDSCSVSAFVSGSAIRVGFGASDGPNRGSVVLNASREPTVLPAATFVPDHHQSLVAGSHRPLTESAFALFSTSGKGREGHWPAMAVARFNDGRSKLLPNWSATSSGPRAVWSTRRPRTCCRNA